MKKLIIKDLTMAGAADGYKVTHLLSVQAMQRVCGGRTMAVLVDGRPGGVVDDFGLNMEIFKGNIGVRVV